MYTLKESWTLMLGKDPVPQWDGKMYCSQTDRDITFRTNETHGFMAAYTFTLVTRGWLTITFSGQQLTLRPDDLYMYSPGMSVTVIDASDDYRGICLLADEHVSIELPTVRDLVRLAYQPIVRLHESKVTLAHADALILEQKMKEISNCIHSSHIYKGEVLRMLYAIFLLDLQNAQEKAIAPHPVPQRTEEIFYAFMRLLPQHFAQHHDIPFYASQLSITPTYLSRIVRQLTGRTVVDYINQMLLMEASFLLRTTSLTIGQVADRLSFADTASFSKFFTRMQGQSPRLFRCAITETR